MPQRFFDMYPKDTLTLPPAPSDDLDDLGAAGKAAALTFNFHKCITDQNLWADAVQAYLASISWTDSQLSRLIAALDASAYADNTVVVLWSDHGFHLRTEAWRYIRYKSGERELYDEVNDPGELKNLASDTRYDAVMAQLDALMPPRP